MHTYVKITGTKSGIVALNIEQYTARLKLRSFLQLYIYIELESKIMLVT